MNPPPAAPPPAPSASPRLPLVVGAVIALACVGLLCIASVGAFAYTRLTPSASPTDMPAAILINPTAVTGGTTIARAATLPPCPTPTPITVGGRPPQATSGAPEPPVAVAPCVTVTPLPTTPETARTPTAVAQAGRTPLPTVAFSGNCPRLPTAALSPSPYISGLTLAEDVQGDAKEPVNPTRQFSPKSIFHAVVVIQDAPPDTRFKAAWFASDVGSAASCNTPIDSFELASEGSRNIDFNLTPSGTWPSGLYRVEISVNGALDSITAFTVR